MMHASMNPIHPQGVSRTPDASMGLTRRPPSCGFLAASLFMVIVVSTGMGCAPARKTAGPQGPAARLSKTPHAGRTAAGTVAHGRHDPAIPRAPKPDEPESRTHAATEAGPQIPVVELSQTPPKVRAVIDMVAAGRPVQKITRVPEIAGHLFRAYIRDEPGPQLLTVDARGEVVDNAVVVRFEDMPQAVRESTKTAAVGKVQVCRKSIHRPRLTYVIDYILGEEEPAYALIEDNGFVLGLYGYAAEDPD